MSSEKYEIAKDEVDSIIEKLIADIKKTEVSQGEAKKRLVQVNDEMILLMHRDALKLYNKIVIVLKLRFN